MTGPICIGDPDGVPESGVRPSMAEEAIRAAFKRYGENLRTQFTTPPRYDAEYWEAIAVMDAEAGGGALKLEIDGTAHFKLGDDAPRGQFSVVEIDHEAKSATMTWRSEPEGGAQITVEQFNEAKAALQPRPDSPLWAVEGVGLVREDDMATLGKCVTDKGGGPITASAFDDLLKRLKDGLPTAETDAVPQDRLLGAWAYNYQRRLRSEMLPTPDLWEPRTDDEATRKAADAANKMTRFYDEMVRAGEIDPAALLGPMREPVDDAVQAITREISAKLGAMIEESERRWNTPGNYAGLIAILADNTKYGEPAKPAQEWSRADGMALQDMVHQLPPRPVPAFPLEPTSWDDEAGDEQC